MKRRRTTSKADASIFNPGKPLATRANRNLFPTVFVDTSATAGPRARTETLIPDYDHPIDECRMRKYIKDPFIAQPDQAVLAASQWSNPNPPPPNKPWLSSWTYPTEEFDPWPREKSGVRCWWCTYPFDWTPFPLPCSYDKYSKKYRVIGSFCGPSCAKAYAANTLRQTNTGYSYGWIDEIAKKYFGYITPLGQLPLIRPAPPKEILQDYCGPKGFTIKQFRSVCVHGRSIELLPPGWITYKQVVEAELEVAKRSSGIRHEESADICDVRTRDVVRVQRQPFAGTGTRRINDYFAGRKSKRS